MIAMFHKIQAMGLVDNREQFLLHRSVNRSVLHCGCVDAGLTEERLATGHLLHQRLAEQARYLTGIDCDAVGVDKLRRLGFEDILIGDLEEDIHLTRKYEIIIAGEVLEHLSNPGRFLSRVTRYLDVNGKLILTVPNAFCLISYMRLFKHIETVHEDHVCYFSPITLVRLLSRFGLIVSEWYGYSDIGRVKGMKKSLKQALNKALLRQFPVLSEGLIIVCHLSADSSDSSLKTSIQDGFRNCT